MELLKKLHNLAIQNAFNEKETADFVNLVTSGTSIDKAIDIVEEGISENKSVKEDVTINKFNEEMVEEWMSLTHLLKELLNEMDYDGEDLLANCGVVSCWIIIKAINDKEYIDSFFQYTLEKHYEPNEEPGPDGKRVLVEIYTSAFGKLDASFKQWTKNPTKGHHFAKTILDTIIKGDSEEGKETYYNLEYSIVIKFFTEPFKYLREKQHSLIEENL